MKPNESIIVEHSTCIGCEKCIKICTSKIFYLHSQDPKTIGLQNLDLCINCGHCVAVCSTNSILHPVFPPNAIHSFDPKDRPTPEQMKTLLFSRRSNRAFSGKEIPQDLLNQIIEAGHRAPTASNSQEVAMVLVTNKEVIHNISLNTLSIFSSLAKKLNNPIVKPIVRPFLPSIYKLLPKLAILDAEMQNGKDLILRDADAVLFFYSPKKSRFGCQDCNLAYQNASLMAETLGVAHFYTGFVCSAFSQNPDKFLKLLGIDGTIHAGMAMGMAAFSFNRYIDKKPLHLTKI